MQRKIDQFSNRFTVGNAGGRNSVPMRVPQPDRAQSCLVVPDFFSASKGLRRASTPNPTKIRATGRNKLQRRLSQIKVN